MGGSEMEGGHPLAERIGAPGDLVTKSRQSQDSSSLPVHSLPGKANPERGAGNAAGGKVPREKGQGKSAVFPPLPRA